MSKGFALVLVLVFLTSSGIIMTEPVSGASVVENSWVEKASIPSPDSGYEAALVNGIIYVIGASCYYVASTHVWNVSSTNYAYNPSNDTWTTIAPMLTPRASFAIAACGNKIYVIGGAEESTTNGLSQSGCPVNEVYDPSTNTWATKASMPTSRIEMQADTVNGKIYVMGGMTGQEYSTMNITEIYDPATDSWSTGTSMPYPVTLSTSAVVNNKIYVIGGDDEYLFSPQTPNSPAVNFTQIYNPATNAWSLGAPIPANTWQAGAGATTGIMAPERIYVFGNCISFGLGSNQSYAYDPATNTWTTAAPLPNPCFEADVAVVNDLLYVIGGGPVWSTVTTNEQYIPIGYNQTSGSPSPTPIHSQSNLVPLASLTLVVAVIVLVAVVVLRHRKKQAQATLSAPGRDTSKILPSKLAEALFAKITGESDKE